VRIWIDAQLSPALAAWLESTFDVKAVSIRDLSMRDAEDPEIFWAARDADAVVMTKDRDFVDLVERFGTPPQILWVTAGNTSNARIREIFLAAFPDALVLLQSGEPLVEISDVSAPASQR
jgi:predicted nuclease of predicted toxin-antitoxin system